MKQIFSRKFVLGGVNKFLSLLYKYTPEYSLLFFDKFFEYEGKYKVFITGGQTNWVLDKDLQYTAKALEDINIELINNPYFADVIHTVWWNKLKYYPASLLKEKLVVGWISNFINMEKNQLTDDFMALKKVVNIWLVPSSFQLDKLANEKIKKYYFPHYVDEFFFKEKNISRYDLCKRFDIDYNRIKNKLIFGSFQRDTQGFDLMSPKPEKGPDNLIQILTEIPNKSSFVLLIAGPRRHFLIRKCIENKIPYIFIGDERIIMRNEDDIGINTLNWKEMNFLYNLIDLYLVTSRSEGGPNAILESSWCKTMVFSSNVGIARDFLHPDCIYSDILDAKDKILNFINNYNENKYSEMIKYNSDKVSELASFKIYKKRINSIYSNILNKHLKL